MHILSQNNFKKHAAFGHFINYKLSKINKNKSLISFWNYYEIIKFCLQPHCVEFMSVVCNLTFTGTLKWRTLRLFKIKLRMDQFLYVFNPCLQFIVSWYLTFFTFACLTFLVFLGAIALAEIQKNNKAFYRWAGQVVCLQTKNMSGLHTRSIYLNWKHHFNTYSQISIVI